jgi:hypothetical protein
MRFQLLILGAVAALTVGAVSLASTPTASVSADRSSVASSATSTEASKAPAAATEAAPAVSEAAVPEPVSITAEIVQQPVAASPTKPQPAPIPAAPAACAAGIQVIQAAPGGRALGRPAIATAIADCFGQSPTGIPPLKNKKLGSGGHSGGG